VGRHTSPLALGFHASRQELGVEAEGGRRRRERLIGEKALAGPRADAVEAAASGFEDATAAIEPRGSSTHGQSRDHPIEELGAIPDLVRHWPPRSALAHADILPREPD
jgi:hypothetical protein